MNTTIEQSNELLTLREKHEYEQEIAGLKAELKTAKLDLVKVKRQLSQAKTYKNSIKKVKG